MHKSYDFVAIGGGSAGFNGARVAASLGKKTAVIEGARALGGLCILKGCMPSKTLIYSGEVLHLAKNGLKFGLTVKQASANMLAINARKRRIIGGFARYRAKQLSSGPFDLIRGTARFISRNEIELGDGQRIRSKKFLIGTGSRVSVPPVPGLADAPFWTSDDVLDLDYKPKSVIILGGGVVACELAQFLSRIGTHVCVIQRSKFLLREHSSKAADVVARALRDEGIEVLTDTVLNRVSTTAAGFTVKFERRGRVVTRSAPHLLNALGRDPDTSRLSLASVGVKTRTNGQIITNRWQQTSAPDIYAAGDCCGPHEIVHVAIQQAELAVRHAFGVKGIKPVGEELLLNVVFTDPQVASIGLNEKQLKARGIRYAAASYPFRDHGKAILMEAKYGYAKVFASTKTGRILGAEVVGKDASELIHCFSGPLVLKATVHDLLKAPWYHPTLAEMLTYPLETLAASTGPSRG